MLLPVMEEKYLEIWLGATVFKFQMSILTIKSQTMGLINNGGKERVGELTTITMVGIIS